MSLVNTLKSMGFIDTVLFLTFGKPYIYQQKSLGVSATVYIRVFEKKILKSAAILPKLFCDRYPAYQYTPIVHLPLYQ